MDIGQATQLRNTVLKNNEEQMQRKIQTSKESTNTDKAFRMKQLEDVANGFEKIFLNMMFSSMRETLNKKDDILNGGFSQDIFEDMLYEQYSDDASKSNYLGFGKMIVAQYEKYV